MSPVSCAGRCGAASSARRERGAPAGACGLDRAGSRRAQRLAHVWSNNISDVAIQARQQEDADEAAAWQATKIAKGWTNGLPPDASAVDASDFAIGTRREQARAARVYAGSLTKSGEGTLFLTGDNAWHGPSTVRAGKLSIVGSHASSIGVAGGTLGGSGNVAGSIDVAGGVLQPGLAPEEAARITDVPVTPGNVLSVGGDVRIGGTGRLAVTVRSGTDYTKLRADGDLALDGQLVLDVQGALTPGTLLTIGRGRSVTGTFDDLPGAPATFGAFTPGVARDYSASTTANVISTAGDATLSVADPSSTATGKARQRRVLAPADAAGQRRRRVRARRRLGEPDDPEDLAESRLQRRGDGGVQAGNRRE
jgi:autotransporter-associated beta strand protein